MPRDYSKYARNWKEIAKQTILNAENRWELCRAENGKRHWLAGSKVVVTVDHVDGDKRINSKYNLIALCQRCHLRLDLELHISNRKESDLLKKQQFSINLIHK